MANNIHFEARRRQMFLDRVANAKKGMALCRDDSVALPSNGDIQQPQHVMCTDQGQFYQTRSAYVWTGPERNRRTYDRSREGPVLGSSWRHLEREMNFRQHSLSTISNPKH